MGCDNSSLVIDRLCDEAEHQNTVVTCFYFDFAARDVQSPVNMLGSLLGQLVSGLEETPEVVVRAFRKQKGVIGGRGVRVSEVLGMLRVATATRRTFICVDALDECAPEHRRVVLGSLGQILRGSPWTRLFMTGRPYVRNEVERELDGATFMSIQPAEEDIFRYIRVRLRRDTTPEIMGSALEAEIMRTIPKITSGTYVEMSARKGYPKVIADIFKPRFLLASLYMEVILQGTTLADRKVALESIKDGAGLGEAYDATLQRIRVQRGEMVKLAVGTLTWVCYSERPLQVDELCHALAVRRGAIDFDLEHIPSIGTLLHCCQGLIVVDQETSSVRLIHYTVQNYLRSHPDLFSSPDSILAETCLTYLSSQQVKNIAPRSLPNHQRMPFLQYASRYWGVHAERELSEHARTLALKLLVRYQDHVSAVSLLKQVTHPNCIEDTGTLPLFSGLHGASFFGIVELMTAIIDVGSCKIDERDCTGSTPLVWAARNGHVRAAELLLEREDVDPNHADKYGRTSLGSAALNGHEGVVRLLLEQEGVDPNRSDKNDETPLGWAAINGHEGVVRLLLERKDVDPNLPDVNDRTPLGCAAVEGHEGVVKLLLERRDVDPNHSDKSDQTPLWCAAFRVHEKVVKLLLEREGVDPNRPDVNNQTPLACAAVGGHEGVVKLLLERRDVDPNHIDKSDRTPLWCAAFRAHEGVVRLLLEREDVDPDRPDVNNQTPLVCAAVGGHEGVVKLLLEREGVDPRGRDAHGGIIHRSLMLLGGDMERL